MSKKKLNSQNLLQKKVLDVQIFSASKKNQQIRFGLKITSQTNKLEYLYNYN